MAAVRSFRLAFSLTEVTKGPLELEIRNFYEDVL